MNICLRSFFDWNSALAFSLFFCGVTANSCMTMVVFEVNTMPFNPPPKPSMFTILMNTYKAQSSAIVQFLWGDNEVADVNNSNNPPGHDEDNEDILGWVPGAPPCGSCHRNGDKHQQLCPTKTKQKRAKYPWMNQKDSLWWKMFLTPPNCSEVMADRCSIQGNLYLSDVHSEYVGRSSSWHQKW